MATSRVDRIIADLNTLLTLNDLVTPSGVAQTYEPVEYVIEGPFMSIHVHMIRRIGEGIWFETTVSFRALEEWDEVLNLLARSEVWVYDEQGNKVLTCGRLGKSLQVCTTLQASRRFKMRLFASTIEEDEPGINQTTRTRRLVLGQIK